MTHIWLESGDIQSIVNILHKHLANSSVLNLKIRNYHWNVKWAHFHDFHSFFEELYTAGAEQIDEIAERIRMLWVYTHGSMKQYLEITDISEETQENISDQDMISRLLQDYETIISAMRKDIIKVGETDDMGTEDFLTGLIQKHEKDAWMLRSLSSKG